MSVANVAEARASMIRAGIAERAQAVPGVRATISGDRVEIAARGLARRRWAEPALRWIGYER